MHVVEKSALVNHSARDMFWLVNDIDSYKEFLPGCHTSRVLSHGDNQMIGEMEIAQAGMKHTFSTHNLLIEERLIIMRLRAGPFKDLRGQWEFLSLREDACKVSLKLEFEFSHNFTNQVFSSFFTKLADQMIDAFCKRADQVYVQ